MSTKIVKLRLCFGEYNRQMKSNNQNIFTILIWGPIFIIPAMALILLLTTVQKDETNYQNSLHALESSIIEKEKKQISQKVINISDLITYEKSIIKEELHKRIKQRVYNARNIALNLYDKYHKTLPEEELKKIIINALRPLLWNEGESYIWIMNYDGVIFLAPEYLRHLEGSSIIDLKDANGREVIKEEIALCKSAGEGFLWDTFSRADEDPEKQFEQLAFVKAFGHYDWYFGSSEYLDTAIKQANAMLHKKISTISSQNNDHIFIINYKGDILLHPMDSSFEGKNIFTSEDHHLAKMVPAFNDVLKRKLNGFVSYEMSNHRSHRLEKKTSYIKQIPDTQWIIGSGFFDSDIANVVREEKEKILQSKSAARNKMLGLGIVLIILSFLISLLISKWIKNKFSIYEATIKSNNTELKKLNESLEYKVEERTYKLKEANEKLEKLATTDALTQIYNRYYFMESIEAEVKRFHRYHNIFSLIMFDIDYFKQINDNYGHNKGDEVLVTISRLVETSLRDTDTLFRFGGEEFMVILPETGLDEAYEIADRMRLLIERHDFGLESATTISIGVVSFQDGDTVDSIVSKADTLLYHSKDEGRNSISKMSVE